MATSSRGVQQDSFIDEDDLTCPLCVEEFDLSDRNFRPCPCGYQVCQFCFNNIKNNMNGLCPACRRPYDEKTMEFKIVTPEEIAQFKAAAQKNAKKKAAERQKEAQKREVESLNRKHLAGLRVVQKNLVYVVGLSPGIAEQDLLKTLRGDKYFGQYGKIIKIVVSKAKNGDSTSNSSLGVYVTFERKEDAARCIAAVNGSQNGERILRAQLGTTKYCSAYLRNETCTNKQCMFLHEPGDNDDSYSRQDLSSINSVSTQRPLPVTTPSQTTTSRQVSQAQAPIQQAQPVAAASQPMGREGSREGSESGDGSALPSSASWANRGLQNLSRRGSTATSGMASSPAISAAITAATDAPAEFAEDPVVKRVEESLVNSAVPIASPKPRIDPLLRSLLQSIGALSAVSGFIDDGSADHILISQFPPLFDEEGGLKRRVMREHMEEAQSSVDHDSRSETQSNLDTQDEEAAISGSLQLGGEPEDRDVGRESSSHGQLFQAQRRTSAQLPIQRVPNDGMYESASSPSIQSVGNLGSMTTRSLTPSQQQHLMLLKSGQPQSSFMDQFPTASPGGLSPFAQQGHNRQSSRYNFANDAVSIKGPSNSKIGNLQSLGHPAGPFYASSTPGPPPGLKSTGTPPSGMFGQAHGFNHPPGGALFGNRDNNEMLRDMLRNRGGTASSQGLDGKREFMFSSYLHQPTLASSSTRAHGVLPSLHGSQPTSLQDLGSKQKKKGKKHRHANTSSSGGGALVDLADPSILQTRNPHHQHQSHAGGGQALFNGQAQDESDQTSLADASQSVDALVADSTVDDSLSKSTADVARISRSSTPAVPPGFQPVHGHPPPVVREEAVAKPPTRIVPTSVSSTPARHASSTHIPKVATSLSTTTSLDLPPMQQLGLEVSKSASFQAKQDVKNLATDSGLSSTIASQASQPLSASILQEEDFPSLEKGKAKDDPKPVETKTSAPVAKKTSGATPTTPAVESKTPTRRKMVGTTTAVTSEQTSTTAKEILKVDTTVATNDVSAAFPPLPPSLPATATTLVPAKAVPKTLRVVSTPKAETLPAISTPPSATSTTPVTTTLSIPPPRQVSLALSSRAERPSTPVSEVISDNISVASTSMSRPGSPPASRIGSAPVRSTTKSQQKKQRKEVQRDKEKSDLPVVVDKPEPEIEIAPIMGRKKKQKKDKPVTATTGTSTPTFSRAPSPVPTAEESNVEDKGSRTEVVASTVLDDAASEDNETVQKAAIDTKSKGKGKIEETKTIPQPTAVLESLEVDELTEKPIPTPASVLQELMASEQIPDPDTLSVFKLPFGPSHRADVLADLQDFDNRLDITDEERATLKAGKAVHKLTRGANRIMLTPNGDCVRNLTLEEEEHYLELQQRILENSGPAAFVPPRHNANGGFTLIRGRAVPNGPPAFFPPSNDPSGQALDAVSRIQRDEALSYINQFVLPSLSTNSQLERALNANALDAELLRPTDQPAWGNWDSGAGQGVDGVASTNIRSNNQTPYGSSGNEGILASGLESMTAHFAVGRDTTHGQPLGNVTLLSLADSESALHTARKETEKLEKSLNQLLKKNKRLFLGTSH